MTEPIRRLPALSDLNREFWTAGESNELRLCHCQRCGYWAHPPSPICPRCWGRTLCWDRTSGRGVLYTYTVNRRAWTPDVPVPYVLGMVELPEQAGLRLTTNIVNSDVEALYIGMPVRVTFEQQGSHFIPLFEPDPGTPGGAAPS